MIRSVNFFWLGLLFATPSALGQTFFDGFENSLAKQWHFGINGDGDPLREKNDARAISDAGLVRIVDEPVRAGGHAVRFEVPRRLGSFRSELALPAVPLFSDYWYGVSIFVPADWIDDPQGGDIVTQWHGSFGEDKKQFKVEGDGKGRPPVALSLHGDHWEVAINSSGAVVKDAKDWASYGSKREKFELGKFAKGNWTDWVFHMRWSYKEDGVVQIWQDGKQVLNHKGPNCYNDPNGPYFKIGIYHPAWKDFEAESFNAEKVVIPRKVIYHDEVRVAANGSYEAVAPRPSRAAAAPVAELMPADEQNRLVQKYCAVCHTDAAKNGGLSLQHFDAAKAPASLVAMLLSKLTGGVLLATTSESTSNASAAALIDARMRTGAMAAAGIPEPDAATIRALIHAFAVESAGAMDWSVETAKDERAGSTRMTASTLREMPSPRNAEEAEAYRLIASCDSTTRVGEVQVTWSPAPHSGTLDASVDGAAAAHYQVEGSEKMGNASGLVLHERAALVLAETQRGQSRIDLPLPADSLAIRNLVPGETVTFSFASLPEDARRQLNACFPSARTTAGLTSR